MTYLPYDTDQQRADGSIPVFQCAPSWAIISAAGSTLVKTGLGQCLALITGTAGLTLSLYDGTSAAGTLITTITPASGNTPIQVQFLTGLYVVATGTGATTVTYK